MSGTEGASVQLPTPSLSYLAMESHFSPPTWFKDSRLNTMSCSSLPNPSGQVIKSPLSQPQSPTDLPFSTRAEIVSSSDKFTMQGAEISTPFQETDVLKSEPALDSQGLNNTLHKEVPASCRTCYEDLVQPSVEVASVNGLSPNEGFQDAQKVSLKALQSYNPCSSAEQKPSKGMQPLITKMATFSNGDASIKSSLASTYPVPALLPPRLMTNHIDSVQMTNGKLDAHKQDGVSGCSTSHQIDVPSFSASDADILMPQSDFGVSVASCYDGNIAMGINAPGTDLSLAIASVVDSGIDQDADVSHERSGMNACSAQTSNSEKSISKKDEMFFKLIQRVRELEVQLHERKEWASQKAMQAACKFSRDVAELSSLRLEHEEILRLKTDTQTLEDSTMKRLTEMEGALRKAGVQVERANASVQKLEVENAELRAEMEAAKLSAAESNAIRQEVARREKKSRKRVQACEKQKAKLLADISDEKERTSETEEHLSHVLAQQQEAEVRWRQEEKAKDEAVLLADAEKWAKEQLENTAKKKEEILRRKADANFQRYKDDVKRLETELGQFRVAAEAAQTCTLRSGSGFAMNSTDTSDVQVLKDIYSRLLNELAELQESRGDVRRDHECVMCMSEERSVVFLPCAHQIVCTKCNDLHEKQGMRDCPSCRTLIKQRIHVFGTKTT